MAWAIGANDVANAMGTSLGSGAITIGGAVLIAGIFEFAGAILAGGHVTDTVRQGMLDTEIVALNGPLLLHGMLASLAAAPTLLVAATFWGMPVSTTHAIVGAIVGFGAVGLGFDAVAWGKVIQIVLSFWVGFDAQKRGMHGLLWGLLVFFTGIVGLIVYLIVAPGLTQRSGGAQPPGAAAARCGKCNAAVQPEFKACPYCGAPVRCPHCNQAVQAGWKVCPYCTKQL